MIRAVADTHRIIWYLFHDPRLSEAARVTIEDAAASGEQVAFSAIALAEIVYLAERGRIRTETFDRLSQAINGEDVVLVEIPFDRAVARAMVAIPREEVADLPGRIIAATASHLGVPVISRDGKIQASQVPTIWQVKRAPTYSRSSS
jgi:PIN domain nuclease of toxin-antitoxin system